MGSDKTTSKTEKDTDLVDRLIGWHHYKTTVSDGKETVVGLGRTPEQSEKRARKWEERKGKG